MYILGISAYFHDSAVALIHKGQIVAAAEEERFSRLKHDCSFPHQALDFVMEFAGITATDISAVVYYEKPFLKFDRLLEATFSTAPSGFSFFKDSFPTWLKDKLFLKQTLKKELLTHHFQNPNLQFSEHHLSHAASAFYPSPFSSAAVLCLDGVGEWTTTSLWRADSEGMELIEEQVFPHSLGLFYSAFTAYCGFKVNSDEYKVMGLAPYGQSLYTEILKKHFIEIKDDGSFRLNMSLFDFMKKSSMLNFNQASKLLGFPARKNGSAIDDCYCDLAASVQKITEEIVLKLATNLKNKTGEENLCLAGGVALNCVANGLISDSKIFKNIWIQPAAGDSGGALGAAYSAYYLKDFLKKKTDFSDTQNGSLLGPAFTSSAIKDLLKEQGRSYQEFESQSELFDAICQLLIEGQIGGLFQGRMEYGPRALGSRSIIADPRMPDGQRKINLSIKFRESFRPFAPAVLKEAVEEYFDVQNMSPYMLIVAKLKKHLRHNQTQIESARGLAKQKILTSDLPAIIHVDYSARLQTLDEAIHPFFTKLVKTFYAKTGCPALVNTSFNINGEPIVCRPSEALTCFDKTGLSFLVLENCLVLKHEKKGINK